MLIIYAQQIFEKKAYVIFCGYAEEDVRNADMLIVWINIYKWACITQFCKVVWVLIDFGIAFSWKSQVTTLHGVLSFCPEQHLNKPLHSPNEISLFSIKQISIMIKSSYGFEISIFTHKINMPKDLIPMEAWWSLDKIKPWWEVRKVAAKNCLQRPMVVIYDRVGGFSGQNLQYKLWNEINLAT